MRSSECEKAHSFQRRRWRCSPSRSSHLFLLTAPKEVSERASSVVAVVGRVRPHQLLSLSLSLSLSLFLFLPPSLPLPSRVHKFTFFRLAECDTRPIRAAPSHAANCFLAAASRPLSPSPSPHAFSSLLWERCSKEILPPYSKRCSLFSAVPFLISPIRPKLLTP